MASRYANLPSFPRTVPDLEPILANDNQAEPPDKYAVLVDAPQWHVYFGYPGYFNAAIDEILNNRWLISTMFTHAATGKMTPEEALTQADQEVRKIFQKWQDAGKI